MATKTKDILEKLSEARKFIKTLDLKKLGRNDYSGYDYYTPEQVEDLVFKACDKMGLMAICNFKADEFGLYQELTLIDLEDKKRIEFVLRTAQGSMKATNEAQQMGGTDTYSERYIKMKVFQIKDNNLDFDSQDHTKSNLPNNNQKYTDDNGVVKEVTGECDICKSKAIPAKTKQGRVFATCPKWKEHLDKKEKFKIIQKPNFSKEDQSFMNGLDNIK